MHVGYGTLFQGPGGASADREAYRMELELAEMAEPLGYQSIWTTEHHFTDYSLSPDPLQFLSYMAGRTKKALLGSMVVVLPWHNPLRLAEEISLLDHLSNGRYVFGFGRGAARREFDRFNIDMSETRPRFIEAAQLILEALEKGYAEFDGKYYKQPNAPIRPAPFKSFRDRNYAAATSPETFEIIAKLGAGLLLIPQKPWEDALKEVEAYRDFYRKAQGVEPRQPIAVGWVMCDKDPERAYELARKHIGQYYKAGIEHYEMRGEHFTDKIGYEFFAKIAGKMRGRSDDKLTDYFVSLHPVGTPEQCYEKILDIYKKVNNSAFVCNFSFGGLPRDQIESGMKLFAKEVIPELRKLGAEIREPAFAAA